MMHPMEPSISWLAAFTVALLTYVLHRRLTYGMRVIPHSLPWSGVRKEWLALPRAHVRELWHSREYIQKGYQKHGRQSKAYLTPNRNWQPEVVLAPEQIKWLVSLPDDVVGIYPVLIEDVAFHYTSPCSWDFARPFHVEALNKMNLALMTDEIIDEIDLCTRRLLGVSIGEHTTIELNGFMSETMARITNRIFAGKEIAHDEDYLACNKNFVFSLIPVSNIIKVFTPITLQPIFGHLFALPCRYFDWRCRRYLEPELKRHMADALRDKETHTEVRNPNMLQLMARFAVRSADPRDWSAHNLASRLLALNFVGIHTSTFAAVNALVDILSAAPELQHELRTEALNIFEANRSRWTKSAVNQLVLLDSTLRESLRFSAFKARGVERQVVAKQGVNLPDGTHLPYGTKIGVPTVDIHKDERFYERAHKFLPDRFLGKAELGMVNTSETFLAFGHGRHACPGRFFSTHELKLLFAHMFMHYEFQHLETRPGHLWVSDFYVTLPTKIKLKRRG